jgi:hypothetical protein
MAISDSTQTKSELEARAPALLSKIHAAGALLKIAEDSTLQKYREFARFSDSSKLQRAFDDISAARAAILAVASEMRSLVTPSDADALSRTIALCGIYDCSKITWPSAKKHFTANAPKVPAQSRPKRAKPATRKAA